MNDRSTLVDRLRRKTVAGKPVFPTPIELEAADHIERLEAALQGIRDADCRGEVCKGIACVALNVEYPTHDRGGERG